MIKNYTSNVDIYTSLGEIQGALAKHGAEKIMIDYDGGKPVAVTFAMSTAQGLRGFLLPAASAVASVIMLSVLCDKECADRDTIRRVWGEVNELADSVITGYVSVADLRRTLCDEYDIII